MKCLFSENKIRLKNKDDEDIIALELDIILFPIKIDLYREMVPQVEKDNMLLCLYDIDKKNQLN